MRLVQFLSVHGGRHVGLVESDGAVLRLLRKTARIYDLALEAEQSERSLAALVMERLDEQTVDYEELVAEKMLLPPLDHPDPAHCFVSGTGLTHLGSAQARDDMHAKADGAEAELTDSMRLFQWGLKGGKPPRDEVSVQPEWFYKGNGDCIVPPEQPLELPSFALDGGEEAELVGLYVIGRSGEILRVGFALGNEFSDHVTERMNYLYLAHSKLRTCSMGPELLIDELPLSVSGRVRIVRDGKELWADTFLTGEANMSYTIANLEYHHFKYSSFRWPGDVHCHFFGTATLSASSGITPRPGDVFEISAPCFGRALRNPLVRVEEAKALIQVRPL